MSMTWVSKLRIRLARREGRSIEKRGGITRTPSQPPRSTRLRGWVSRRDIRGIVADIVCKGGSRPPRTASFAFCKHSVQITEVRARARKVRVIENARKHLEKATVKVSARSEGRNDERGTLFKVVLTGLMSFPPGPPLSSMSSSFLTS